MRADGFISQRKCWQKSFLEKRGPVALAQRHLGACYVPGSGNPRITKEVLSTDSAEVGVNGHGRRAYQKWDRVSTGVSRALTAGGLGGRFHVAGDV